MDPDERVRIAAIQVLDTFDTATLELISNATLMDVAMRCRDKKVCGYSVILANTTSRALVLQPSIRLGRFSKTI